MTRALAIAGFVGLGLSIAVTVPVGAATAEEALFAATRAGKLSEVRRLVEAGADVHATEKWGQTPLLAAAINGEVEIARYLLDHGADPNQAESFHGADPLSWALMQGHPEVVVVLLEGGADDRETALEAALDQGLIELARAAVEGGPIYESRLAAMRSGAADLDPALVEILGQATPRPDLPPPTLSEGELARFVGSFEGHTSDRAVDVRVADGRLTLSVDRAPPVVVTPIADQQFRSADGAIEASFFGRAGTIEGLGLSLEGQRPESLRHTVAEPVGSTEVVERLAATQRPKASETITRNWPQFRGLHASGIGDGIDTPTTWDLETGEGVIWQTPLPGLGNSSPVVWGERVFVTTAIAEGVEQKLRTGLTGSSDSVDESVEHSWRVLAFDKRTGERMWDTEVGRAVPLTKRHFKATQASSTPATDGEHLVVVFPTAGLACLGLDGTLHWKHELGGLNAGSFNSPSIEWGYASSPIIHGGRVILQVDIHEGPYLAAWDLETGEQVWRTERDVAPSWATPTVARGPEAEELIVNGSTIHGYDPGTGEELWSLGPTSELVIATPIAADGVAYVSAGYPPAKPIYAVRLGARGVIDGKADGDGALEWSHSRGGAYMPSPLLYRGLYYVVHHNGRIVAYEAASGTAVYKSRFSSGGTFTGSPVAANGKLYLPTEEGTMYVLAAGPELEELAVHDFGEPLMATPAISEGTLFVRSSGRLIALGRSDAEAQGGFPVGGGR